MKNKKLIAITLILLLMVTGCGKNNENIDTKTITCTYNSNDVKNGYKMQETKKVTYKDDMTITEAISIIDIKFLNEEAKNDMKDIIESYESMKEIYNNGNYYQGTKLDVETSDNKFRVTYTYDIAKLNEESLNENEFKDYILKNNKFDINKFQEDNKSSDATCVIK